MNLVPENYFPYTVEILFKDPYSEGQLTFLYR